MKLENILFLDIETVPQHPSFFELTPEEKQLLQIKRLINVKKPPQRSFMNVLVFGRNLVRLYVFLLGILCL